MQLSQYKTVAVLAILAWMALALHASEPDLSASETTMVNRRIASLKSSGDRHMAMWLIEGTGLNFKQWQNQILIQGISHLC